MPTPAKLPLPPVPRAAEMSDSEPKESGISASAAVVGVSSRAFPPFEAGSADPPLGLMRAAAVANSRGAAGCLLCDSALVSPISISKLASVTIAGIVALRHRLFLIRCYLETHVTQFRDRISARRPIR